MNVSGYFKVYFRAVFERLSTSTVSNEHVIMMVMMIDDCSVS